VCEIHDPGHTCDEYLMLSAKSGMIDCGTNMRPDGAIRGMWRILDGKDESGMFSCSEL
jgi:hypothetical protein